MKAIIGAGPANFRFIEDFDAPAIQPRAILVRVHAVALSPQDGKIAEITTADESLAGHDFSGTVVAVGDGVTRFREGDRILAVAFGSNPLDRSKGAFGEFALADEDFTCRIPDRFGFAQACSIGLSAATAGLALFQSPGLMLSMEHGLEETVLVSGGATATGTMAMQLLRMAGYDVVVTCSPVNNDLCKSYGASACFDYHSPTCGADIRVHTNNSLTYVLDCVTSTDNMKMCYEAIGFSGGNYIALEPIAIDVKYTRRDIRAEWIVADSIAGDGVQMPGMYGRPRTPNYRQFGQQLFALIERGLQERSITPHPVEVLSGGLESLPGAIANANLEKMRASKLVMPVLAS